MLVAKIPSYPIESGRGGVNEPKWQVRWSCTIIQPRSGEFTRCISDMAGVSLCSKVDAGREVV